jgi:hypothetical protein
MTYDQREQAISQLQRVVDDLERLKPVLAGWVTEAIADALTALRFFKLRDELTSEAYNALSAKYLALRAEHPAPQQPQRDYPGETQPSLFEP